MPRNENAANLDLSLAAAKYAAEKALWAQVLARPATPRPVRQQPEKRGFFYRLFAI
jgi:hypothetical protein